MIQIFKTMSDGLKELSEIDTGCWINLVRPENGELDDLAQRTGIPLYFLTDPLDIDERARIEIEDDFVLIVLRIPHLDPDKDEKPFTTLPLGIILMPELMVTVCAVHTDIISDFINAKLRRTKFSTENRERFSFQIFFKTALYFLKYLRAINYTTSSIETELHKSMKNQELIRLLHLEESLVYFTTSLKANEIMMGRLAGSKLLKISADDAELLEDVIVETRQAIEMANIYSSILSGMMGAFASIISNNLNVAMKFLTAFTIILMLPNLVAGIYGMNIRLPFQESSYAFPLVMGISFLLSAVGVIFLIKRKFF